MEPRISFTEAERAYLVGGRQLGRLATVGVDGTPHVVPVAFFYNAVVFNPEETSENLKRNGGFIPGIRPGKRTADYLDYVLTRITVIGAGYLALVCVLPEYIIGQTGLPFFLGGTSLLIVVNVTVDTIAQIQSHLLAHQYGDLIKKAKLKGRLR